MYKKLNVKELRLTANNRNINGYESMAKDKLLRIINNNKRQKESSQVKKKEETKKSLYKPTKIVLK